MPKMAHDLAEKLIEKGKPKDSAWAIATAAMQKQMKKKPVQMKKPMPTMPRGEKATTPKKKRKKKK